MIHTVAYTLILIMAFVGCCMFFVYIFPNQIRPIRQYWRFYTNGDPPEVDGLHPQDARDLRLQRIPAEDPEAWPSMLKNFCKDYTMTRDEAMYLLQSLAARTKYLNEVHFILFDFITECKPIESRDQQNLFYFYQEIYLGDQGKLLIDLLDGIPSSEALAAKY